MKHRIIHKAQFIIPHDWHRLFGILLFFTFHSFIFHSSLSAQTIGEAFYIYRNDGNFNAFFREEIDSIAYSCYDVDSLLHDDIVTQVVFTEDSVYRIPLEAIDSVSFVQPETVYKADVVMMHSLIDYIVRVEGKTLYISTDIPSSLIPKVGDVLYFEAVTELFPEGFSGRVSQVTDGTEIIVKCEQVALEDIFEQVTECLEFDVIPNGSEVKSLIGSNFSSDSYTLPVHFGADYLGAGASIDGSITIKVHGKSIKQLEVGKDPYVDLSATINIDTELSYSFTEGLSYNHDFNDKEIPVNLPYGLVAKILVTPFLECSVQGALTTTVNTYSSQTLGVRYSHGRIQGYSQKSSPTITAEASLAGSASAFAGLKVQGSVGFVGDLGKLTLAVKAGPRVEGKFTVASTSFDNTNGYDVNRDNKITAHGRVALEATAGLYLKVLGAEVGKLEASVSPFTWDFLEKSWYVVPQFSDMQYEAGDDLSEALVSARVSRDLISPMTVGMALFDGNKQLVEKQQASSQYKTASIFSNPLTLSFTGLTPGKRYTVYPYVQVMGYEYLASPSLSIGEDVIAETGEVTEITSKTATIAGRVTGEDASRHEFGVYYIPVGSEDWKSIRAKERSNEGVFSVQLEELEKDTEYAYCTYVNMGTENLYGDVLKFRTAKGMAVITGDATEITDSSAVLHGQLSDYEIDQVKEYGISYSTSPDDIQYVPASFISNDGSFSVKLSGLTEQTKYYYAAYAYINDDEEEYYGEARNFTTSEQKNSTVTTGEATEITSTSAVLSGRIQNYDATAVTEYGIKYFLEGNEPNVVSATNIVDGTFSVELSNLTSQKIYTYYAYIILRGIEVCGEAKTFTVAEAPLCPDANHPHMIDLGLSSGTKWACCNIGAHAPEQYGGFYAWGETQTKSIYNADTYIFDNQDIGSDISQGDYDVAFSRWGNDFAMPTQAQVTELLNECEYEWGVYNGIQGAYFTGTNGKKIFLPADGNRWDGDSHWNVEFGGYYWTSTQNPNRSWHAYGLNFTSASAIINSNDRSSGQMVRPIMKKKETTCPDANHPHMIDLGIGTMWACCNVGASSPEQYGNYYAWGETQPKSVYNWDTYRYGSDYDELTKYCTKSSYGRVDNKTVLDASDDAATANWGAPWRMPTLAECQDLVNKCSSEWTTVNGVYGRKFTGPNGGTIFLPAAGNHWGGELLSAGSHGDYWSSALGEGDPGYAYYLSFGSGYAGWGYYNRRFGGRSVRPVR